MAKMKWMKKPKPELHVVSLSGGKDSTAMLLRMLEEGMRVDIILFCDTGLEFPAMYEHLAKLEKDIGRPITRIRSFHTFEYYLTQKEILVKHKKNAGQRNYRGYGWSGPLNRWCTKELKTIPREKFLRQLQEHYDIIEYVGLAADEGYRFERENNQKPNCRHPLVDWGMTEADCLQYCYDRGYTWGGLYKLFLESRVGAAHCSRSPSCGSCTRATRSSGHSSRNGINGHGASSKQTIPWRNWKRVLILRNSGRQKAKN